MSLDSSNPEAPAPLPTGEEAGAAQEAAQEEVQVASPAAAPASEVGPGNAAPPAGEPAPASDPNTGSEPALSRPVAAPADTDAQAPSPPNRDSQRPEVERLFDQLKQKDAQLQMLQKQLQHYRSWVSKIYAKMQQVDPRVIKNARRLYVGGVPSGTTDDELLDFFNDVMIEAGARTAPRSAVISCKIAPDKNFAFIEFRSVEETSNVLAFDGILFRDAYLKIRRPSNYDGNVAIVLGPMTPDPTVDTSGLEVCRTVVEDSPHKLFIGGLPGDWTEEQVKKELMPYGALKSFNLVMDKARGKSKCYAFCEFQDEALTPVIIKALNNKKLGQRTLTVKRALEGMQQKGGELGGGMSSLASLFQGSAGAHASMGGYAHGGLGGRGPSGPSAGGGQGFLAGGGMVGVPMGAGHGMHEPRRPSGAGRFGEQVAGMHGGSGSSGGNQVFGSANVSVGAHAGGMGPGVGLPGGPGTAPPPLGAPPKEPGTGDGGGGSSGTPNTGAALAGRHGSLASGHPSSPSGGALGGGGVRGGYQGPHQHMEVTGMPSLGAPRVQGGVQGVMGSNSVNGMGDGMW